MTGEGKSSSNIKSVVNKGGDANEKRRLMPPPQSRTSNPSTSNSPNQLINKETLDRAAFKASEELRRIAEEQHPLWIFDAEKKTEVLNLAEYNLRFAPQDQTLDDATKIINPSEEQSKLQGSSSSSMMEETPLMIEASRAIGFVNLKKDELVDVFMDMERWSSVFSNMVSKVEIVGMPLITKEQGNPSGLVKVINAEYHFSSPLVPDRKMSFVRYYRQLARDSWLVVDVSLENVLPTPTETRCQRRPSGCLIQSLSNGLTKVTWVENNAIAYDDVPEMFKLFITCGSAFCAARWLATLERYSDRKSTLDNDNLGVGKKSGLELAERMLRRFHDNISYGHTQKWQPIPYANKDILIRTSLNEEDPGIPKGVAINFVTSVWLPESPHIVFNFLCDTSNRNKWDLLYLDRVTRESMVFSPVQDSGGRACMVLVEATPNKPAHNYIQQSFKDSIASFVVYAPLDVEAMYHILEGKDQDIVAILPSGFAILPDGRKSNGSLLTISFEIIDEQLASPETLPSQSVAMVYNIMSQTIAQIKKALSRDPCEKSVAK